jgi:hypothetical protein
LLVLEREGLIKTLKSIQQSTRSLETIISKKDTKQEGQDIIGGRRIIKNKITKRKKYEKKNRGKLTKKMKKVRMKKVRFHKTTKKHV